MALFIFTDYSPVTKLLLGGVFASTVAVTFPLSNKRHLFMYSPEDIIDGKQVLISIHVINVDLY